MPENSRRNHFRPFSAPADQHPLRIDRVGQHRETFPGGSRFGKKGERPSLAGGIRVWRKECLKPVWIPRAESWTESVLPNQLGLINFE